MSGHRRPAAGRRFCYGMLQGSAAAAAVRLPQRGRAGQASCEAAEAPSAGAKLRRNS